MHAALKTEEMRQFKVVRVSTQVQQEQKILPNEVACSLIFLLQYGTCIHLNFISFSVIESAEILCKYTMCSPGSSGGHRKRRHK